MEMEVEALAMRATGLDSVTSVDGWSSQGSEAPTATVVDVGVYRHACSGMSLAVGMKAGTGRSRTDRHRIPYIPIIYRISGKKTETRKSYRKTDRSGIEFR